MMQRWLFVLALAVCAHAVLADLPFVKVNNDTKFYTDASGRTRLFHGVNAVYKIFPWHPEPTGFDPQNSLSEIDAQNLASWGFNVVRLGVEWPGVEPENNQFNVTYLDVIENIVDTLAKYDIYTIVDCHQDIFSRYYCGEGVPDWAVPHSALPFPLPALKETLPLINGTKYPELDACLEHAFARYYFSDAVSNGFQSLYDNTHGLQDEFTQYWETVASRFKNSSSVLGFELINEPWAGNLYKDPKLLLSPGYADKVNLAPMYSNLHNAIRKIDDEHILFFEPSVADIFRSGFDQGPGGPSYNDRQAYSYHIYCAPVDQDGDPTHLGFCNLTDTIMYAERVSDYHRIGVGGFMTEFGAMMGTEAGVDSLNFVAGQADKYIQSWTYWSFKSFHDITTVSTGGGESFYLADGSLDEPKVRALARTYAPIIAGTPSLHEFNPLTAIFNLSYTVNTAASPAQTEIYVSTKYWYPSGFSVSFIPKNAASYVVQGNKIVVTHADGLSGVLSITVSPQ